MHYAPGFPLKGIVLLILTLFTGISLVRLTGVISGITGCFVAVVRVVHVHFISKFGSVSFFVFIIVHGIYLPSRPHV